VQDKIAAVTRTCAYDRAGIMWSDPKRTPQNADAVARDLHATLRAAGETGPFVMVGHSLGGPYILDYTRLFPTDVSGLVFVDASHPDQFKRFKAAGLPYDAAPFAFKAMAAMTWIGWTRLPSPPDTTPNISPHSRAASVAYTSTSLAAALAEAEALNQSVDQAGQIRALGPHPLGDRPLVVLTATEPFPDKQLAAMKMTRAKANTMQALWKSLHDDEASWSTRSRHQLVPDSTHYIQFFRPDIVIAAVTEVVGQVRADQAKPAKPAK
jgi:pimeloyl-ACP methyl ester carboxylesterase